MSGSTISPAYARQIPWCRCGLLEVRRSGALLHGFAVPKSIQRNDPQLDVDVSWRQMAYKNYNIIVQARNIANIGICYYNDRQCVYGATPLKISY